MTHETHRNTEMTPRQWRRAAIQAVVVLVICVIMNLVLGNGFLPGLVVGLCAAVVSFVVQWLLTRSDGGPAGDS
ncbi:hypothetical protein [Kineosporia sp. NBRC 101731]|uniref:hypothetical protein n=1 Tax=Kineosporia sp. NBRC 101731 TaxID=3032199 RepID=UPI0024A011FD|nr:hypothetical protein [Kineosporia sp. NBRC 101731]GLY30572.1 hypothetical protein Kisp02_39370 [Kineosporia sp. NBRC 101731]